MDPDLEADEEEADLDVDVADDMEADTDMEMDDEMLAEDQGAVDKEDEHLGAKDGKEADKKQSMKDRRKEERGEDRAKGKSAAAVEEGAGPMFGDREKAWRRIARGGTATKGRSLDKPAGHRDYEPDPSKGEKDYTPTPEEAAKARAHAKANPTSSRDKFPRRGSSGGGGMKIGGITSESQDELVEQITKRVAARILKAALTKK